MKSCYEIIEIHLVVMVDVNHSQKEHLGMHEYKCSQTTFARNFLWLVPTIIKNNL